MLRLASFCCCQDKGGIGAPQSEGVADWSGSHVLGLSRVNISNPLACLVPSQQLAALIDRCPQLMEKLIRRINRKQELSVLPAAGSICTESRSAAAGSICMESRSRISSSQEHGQNSLLEPIDQVSTYFSCLSSSLIRISSSEGLYVPYIKLRDLASQVLG